MLVVADTVLVVVGLSGNFLNCSSLLLIGGEELKKNRRSKSIVIMARSDPRCLKIVFRAHLFQKNCSNFSSLNTDYRGDSTVERLCLQLNVLNRNQTFQIPFYICF